MSAQIQKSPQNPSPITQQWIYDQIMLRVEAELTTDQLPLLEERYKNEDRESFARRMKRYADAFDLFDQVLEAVAAEYEKDEAAREKKSKGKRAASEKKENARDMKKLEKLIDDALDTP